MAEQEKSAEKRNPEAKDGEEHEKRPKDLTPKEEKGKDVKGGRMSAWSDARLKRRIRAL